MSTLRIAGGKLVDPLHAANGQIRDIGIRDDDRPAGRSSSRKRRRRRGGALLGRVT